MPTLLRHTKHRTFELDLPITTKYTMDVLHLTIQECLALTELLEVKADIKILNQEHFDVCTALAAGLLQDGAHIYTTLQLDVKTDACVDDEEIRLALEVAFQTFGTVMSPGHPFEIKAFNMGRPLTERCALFDGENSVRLFGSVVEYTTPNGTPRVKRRSPRAPVKKQKIC
jgi:hypothetical protein